MATKDYLQKRYADTRYLAAVDEWPPYQPRHYTTLAIIHHKDKYTSPAVLSVTKELAVAGKFQSNLEGLTSSNDSMSQASNLFSNATKNVSDIFAPFTTSDGLTKKPCIVLIEGAPGIGKTVLAKEIAFQWANNKLLRDKNILFLLPLRQFNFNTIITTEKFVEHVVRSSESAACLVKHFKDQSNDLVIIFDGYDEISEDSRTKSIIADIIDRKIFSECCLVITSRPTSSSHLHKKVDCRLEIVGFTEDDRLDYIQTALQSKDDEKVQALMQFLKSNPTINALCYIPLNMTILLCLVEGGMDQMPKTQTDMYKKFVEMTIKRFIQKIDVKKSQVITNVTKLPYPYTEVFEELTKLAFNALTVDKIVFHLSEINEVCPNLAKVQSNWNGLGFLKAVEHINTEIGNVTFHFLHFSIQEYMAALYISTLSNNQQIKLLQKTFWHHRYYNTWIMYVGITCGSSFALKHFLSGHWFQLFTRIFKTSVSKKILENKIKCLHLFQCLVESNKEDMISLVSHFFQEKQIDLSNQTLLPRDVSTLGFFLVRSINKRWEMLNLAGCNIGNTGINLLCDRFLNKESRDLLTITTINFSHNQLDFSSLVQLFDLFKSWNASELIIRDNKIFERVTSINKLCKAIDDVFLSSYCDNQVSLELGSFLFGLKVNTFSKLTESVKVMYLFNCEFSLDEASNFKKQNLNEIHLINTSLPIELIKKISSNINILNVFIYNPKLSDQDADEVCRSISSDRITKGIKLIISSSKIQGTINTSSISKQLTKLEISNFASNIDQKCSNHMQTHLWKGNLYYDSSTIHVEHIFIELLHKIICNKWNWQLKILLEEKDIFIAHRINHETIAGRCRSPRSIYLNACNIKTEEYENIFRTNRSLAKLYVFNSPIDQGWLKMVKTISFSCTEIFLHSQCDISIEENHSCFGNNCSAVLVTKNEMLGCNPTTEQTRLAFKLEPLISVLGLIHCQSNQVSSMLTAAQNNLSEVDFTNCQLKETDYEMLQDHLRYSTIDMLKISSKQLTKLLVPKFIQTIILWKVKQLIFYDIDQAISECFKEKFTTTVSEKVYLSVTHNNKKDVYFNDYKWSEITQLLKNNEGASLFIINCRFPLQAENINIIKLSHISKLCIINSTLDAETIVNIVETFIGRTLEISIYNSSKCIDYKSLYEFITSKRLVYQTEISFVAVMENFMCGYNTTEDQLQLLQSKILDGIEYSVVNLVSDTKQMHERELFVFENKQLTTFYSVGEALQPKFVTKLVDVLKQISSLKSFGIDKYTVSRNVINDIVTAIIHNKELEKLYLNSTMRTADLLNIMKVLERFINLRVLEIANNDITDQVTESLTSIMSHNTQLQFFSVTNGNVLNANVVKISKALQNTCNLQELTITGNNIVGVTNIVAMVDDKTCEFDLGNYNKQTVCITLLVNRLQSNTAEVTECNTERQVDCDSKNCLQVTDAMAIAKVLQNSFTLKKLCINNKNTTKEEADVMAATICTSKELQELDVSENSLNSTDAIKIAKALQKVSTLTKLYINSNKMTDIVANDIAAALSCNTQLQELNINENQFQASGIMTITEPLRHVKTLTKLYISDTNITDKTASNIADTIYSNTQLQELDVSKNHLLSPGAIKIAKAVQNVCTLTKLYINNNHITSTAAHDIGAALSCNSNLQELDISENKFRTRGVIKIVKALHTNLVFKKMNISDNDITDEAADDIAVIIRRNTHMQEFNFSRNKFEMTGALKIVKALQSVSTLTKLYFGNNCITDEVAGEIGTILYNNIKLQELDISNIWFQTASILTISKILQKIITLTKLYISNNDVTDESADDIADVIYQNTQLREFSIRLTKLSRNGIECITRALCSTKHLRELKIEGIGVSVTDEAAESIAAVVSSNNKLQIFDISKTNFSPVGFTKITNALQNIATLIKLYVSNNNITAKSADGIAAVICHNSELEEFDVSRNDLQSAGATKIAKALQKSSTLRKLCINSNNIMDTAVDDIANVIYKNNTELHELDISKNWFKATSIVTIAKAIQSISNLKKLYINYSITESDVVTDDIAAALTCSGQLEVLDISGNRLEASGIIKIAKALQKISTLEQLYINNNKITDRASDDIAAICSHNTHLQVLHFNKNSFTFTKASELCQRCKEILNSNIDICAYD